MNFLTIAVVLIFCITCIDAHGRLLNPPGRSSLWRVVTNANIPRNYDDNALFCGGFSTQWNINGGKCGVCGDSFSDPQPRQNEAGGKYGRGYISRTYSVGEKIDIEVQLTAHHKGYFEFRLCPNDDVTKIVKQECLDQNLLILQNGETKYYPTKYENDVRLKAYLPEGLTCTQCVLQWKYHSGNSWGRDANGNAGIGVGPQEEFYGCSDIAITNNAVANTQSTTTNIIPMPVTTSTSFEPSNFPTTLRPQSTRMTTRVSTTPRKPRGKKFPGRGIKRCSRKQVTQRYLQYSCTKFVQCTIRRSKPTKPMRCGIGTVVNYVTNKRGNRKLVCDHRRNTPPPCGKKQNNKW